jgi:RNA polymerase sigma factor (sigma-70 family)
VASIASEWVTATRTSDDFERLFIAEYARVTGIALRVLGDPHAAEDVAQEVFCQFYRLHPVDAPYARPWLYRAAAHAALNTIRGSRRRSRREAASPLGDERLVVAQHAEPDPANAVVTAEGVAELRVALGRISRKYASVLVLRYSGLSYAEVGDALGVGTGQVGTLLRRAEDALRKEMTRGTSR